MPRLRIAKDRVHLASAIADLSRAWPLERVTGAITDFADGNRASILRTSENNAQYSVRLKDLIKRGDVSANVEMKPGDILIIPQSWF